MGNTENTPKYSVIIPTRNGLRYLPYAIDSILQQSSIDFELIVSDNHSSDGTWDYLTSLSDPRLRIVKPDQDLSMAKHFEFAIEKAEGVWVTVLGDDDALQPYFFDLAEKLTLFTVHPVISSPRAYYFWPGCEIFYSDSVVSYTAIRKTSTLSCHSRLLELLLTPGEYFDYPQFYTGTLFRNDLIKNIKTQQGGQIFKSLNLDANSVALIFQHTRRYTYSHIPLAWIGSSPKSTGFAHFTSATTNDSSQKLVEDFDELNRKDKICSNTRFPHLAYIKSTALYFLESFFQLHIGTGSLWDKLLKFKPTLYVLFSKVYRDYRSQTYPAIRKAYEETFAANGLNLRMLKITSALISFAIRIKTRGTNKLRKLKRIMIRPSPGNLTPSNPAEVGELKYPDNCSFISNSRSEFATIDDASAMSIVMYRNINQSPKSPSATQ